MLRALQTSRARPHRVPWRVDRIYDAHPLVTNASDRPLDFVRVFVDAGGMQRDTQQWGQMLPGETAELCLCAHDRDDTVVTLAWFRQDDGVEFVWRFAP